MFCVIRKILIIFVFLVFGDLTEAVNLASNKFQKVSDKSRPWHTLPITPPRTCNNSSHHLFLCMYGFMCICQRCFVRWPVCD